MVPFDKLRANGKITVFFTTPLINRSDLRCGMLDVGEFVSEILQDGFGEIFWIDVVIVQPLRQDRRVAA